MTATHALVIVLFVGIGGWLIATVTLPFGRVMGVW